MVDDQTGLDAFTEPADRAEAAARMTVLRSELAKLGKAWSGVRRNLDPARGDIVTAADVKEVRSSMRTRTEAGRAEMNFLQAWVDRHVLSSLPAAEAQGADQLLLWRCADRLQRLERSGLVLTGTDHEAIAQAGRRLAASSPFLELARVAIDDRPANILQFGSLIARISGHDEDRQRLERVWEDLFKIEPRDEGLLADCAERYVGALVCLGDEEGAVDAIERLGPDNAQTAYCWLNVLERMPSSYALRYAREFGVRLDPLRRLWFFAKLFHRTGEVADEAMALPSAEQLEALGPKRGNAFRTMMTRLYAQWGRYDEARTVLVGDLGPDDKANGWAYVARWSGRASDREQLLAALKAHGATRTDTARVAACAFVGTEGQQPFEELLGRSRWTFACAGYSALALYLDDRAQELVHRAAGLAASYERVTSMLDARAFLHLACMQARLGDLEAASRTVERIGEMSARCRGLLALHATRSLEPVPMFLEEY